jgi:hypothetical protein
MTEFKPNDDGSVEVYLDQADLEQAERIARDRIYGGAPMSQAFRERVQQCPTCADMLARNHNLNARAAYWLRHRLDAIQDEYYLNIPVTAWWQHLWPILDRWAALNPPYEPRCEDIRDGRAAPASVEVRAEIARRQEVLWEQAWAEMHT